MIRRWRARRGAPILALITWLYILWSIVPVLVAVRVSFNDGRSRSTFQPMSMRWYWGDPLSSVWHDDDLHGPPRIDLDRRDPEVGQREGVHDVGAREAQPHRLADDEHRTRRPEVVAPGVGRRHALVGPDALAHQAGELQRPDGALPRVAPPALDAQRNHHGRNQRRGHRQDSHPLADR